MYQAPVCCRIFCLNEANNMEFYFLPDICSSRQCFCLEVSFAEPFFLGSMLSLQIIQMGLKGLFIVLFSFFPHFICYGIAALLLFRRNAEGDEREETAFYGGRSFSERFSIQIEIILVILGCVLESYVNPSVMAEILKMFS